MTATAAVVPIHRDGDNPHKVVNQYRRAKRFAKVMLDHGATAETIVNADAMTVRLVTELLGEDPPSEVTWALALELVKEATQSDDTS